MERSSQLILRNSTQLAAGEILLVNPPADDLFRELTTSHGPVSIWCQDFGDYSWFHGQGAEVGFGVVPDRGDLPPQVILFQPREKERLELLLHHLAAALPAGGDLWLVGENQAGIKSAGKRLEKYFNLTVKGDTARHCVLFRAAQPSPPGPFKLENYQQKWLLGSPPTQLRMVSLPGAFAHGRLDLGTELLLEVLANLKGKNCPSGTVLDFGCGIGVIGLTLLVRDPQLDLTLLDNSALALESARLSLQANGLEAKLLPSDGLGEVRQRYDWIVSNPPFHRGVGTNYDIAQRFFAQSRNALTRHGKMLLVCNRHLPYEGWLADNFGAVDTVESRKDFKVLLATRPKS